MHYRAFIEGPDIYQFEWPYFGYDANILGRCHVTIYLKGVNRPTVVFTQNRTNHGTSITNFSETLATQIYRVFLQRLGLSPDAPLWIEHYDWTPDNQRWQHVIFTRYTQNSGYEDPKWENTDPVTFDPSQLITDTYTAYQIETVSETLIPLDSLFLGKGECYQVRTGVCSLSVAAQPDDNSGEDGYQYCRSLARMAHIWEIAQHVVQEDSLEEAMTTDNVVNKVESLWSENFGIRPTRGEINSSIWGFGAGNFAHAIVGHKYDDGTVTLSDGRHRVCVAHHLEIPVRAFIETERKAIK